MDVRFFTGQQLKEAIRIATERGYNRAPTDEFTRTLSDTARYPITFEMIHEHAAGARVPSHVRCMVRTDQHTVWVDTDMDLWKSLDSVEIPDAEVVGRKPSETSFSQN